MNHKLKIAGTEVTMHVIDIECDEISGVMSSELRDVLKETHREKGRVHVDALLQKKIGKVRAKADHNPEALSRMRLAMCGFGDEMHEGMASDLKVKSRLEMMQQLCFKAGKKGKNHQKIKKHQSMKKVKKKIAFI